MESQTFESGSENPENLELSGLLSRFPLAEVMQFLGMSEKSGELRITEKDGSSIFKLFFQNGQLVHAEGHDLEGMAAFEIALLLQQGSFLFHAGLTPRKCTLDKPVHFLLLESQRRVDELREINNRIPPGDNVLFIVGSQDSIPGLSTLEWQVLSMINGRRTLSRICQKMGDELTAKKGIQSLMAKGLITARSDREEWHAMVPKPVSVSRVREERPYPPLLRTNLLLKAIDGKSNLLELQNKLRCREGELLEDVKVLHETRWIEFTVEDEKVFQRMRQD